LVIKFATGNATAPEFKTLYALVQWTPDLSELDCNSCLVDAIQRIPGCCDNKEGGRVIGPSCNLRFEIYQFSNWTAAASPPSSPATSTTSISSSTINQHQYNQR